MSTLNLSENISFLELKTYTLIPPLTVYVQRPVKGTLANSVEPDQTPQNAASGQGLHCLH